MLFSSITFLYYFLPCVLAVYFLAPGKMKNVVLLIASLFFYGWGEPRFVLLMMLTICVGYAAGILTERYPLRRKICLFVVLLFDLGALAYFKYADFFLENVNALTGMSLPMLKIALPIGISFYTFQILSYNIDVYRGEVPAQKNLIHLATYITMFPQLVAGPIVRYRDIEKKLIKREHNIERAANGIRRFAIGLAKKVLIANSFGELCEVFRASGDQSVLFYWMYAVGFSLQIYFDFSGYSDMAIGLGKILGFDFSENFNYPYISKSITEFWRRWHISLGTWFKDYVYIPLGGSRVGKARRLFNILTVWMLTGFWHGASWNFIVWGLYFALLLMMEKLYLRNKLEESGICGHLYVLFTVIIGFVIFQAPTLGQAVADIGGMFGAGGLPLISAEAIYYLKSYAVLFVIAIAASTPVFRKLAKNRFLAALEPVILLALLVLSTAYLVDGSFNPFLYFRF